jgi:hypothetical protein
MFGCLEAVQLSLTQDRVIARFFAKHGNKYDYSRVVYRGSFSKVTIICPEHGKFEQEASNHWRGQGCFECGRVKNGDSKRKSTLAFIEEARKIHGDKYDYVEVNYINNHTFVKIYCPIHGVFKQAPQNHLIGQGCPECGSLLTADKHRLSQEGFITLAKNKNIELGREYNYSLVNYVNNAMKVKIICPEHGIFEQNPASHLSGIGCPKCGRGQKSTEDGIWLDSGWEVKVWNWCKRNKVSIFRGKENGGNLFYMWKDKKHYTEIDFIINGRLVEVKGDSLLLGVIGNIDMMKEKLNVYRDNNVLVVCGNTSLLPKGISGVEITCFDRTISDWNEAEKNILGVNSLC